MKNFIYEWKFALFNILIYSLFVFSLSYLTGFQMIGLFVWGWLCCTLGNSVLLHRYYTHKQFKLNKIAEYCLIPFAIIIGIGSSIQYALLHRHHHTVCDQSGDPHSPSKLGMFTVMTGLWEFFPTRYFVNLRAPMPKDLITKPLHRFMHNNYYLIWILALIVCSTISWKVAIAIFSWAAVYQKVWENIVVNGLCHPSFGIIKDWKIFGFATGGESMQWIHHNDPQQTTLSNNWLVDPGALIVNIIKEKTK